MKCECGKEFYFLHTSNGRSIPVNAESLSKEELEAVKRPAGHKVFFNYQKHITHFADCPSAARFRKEKVK